MTTNPTLPKECMVYPGEYTPSPQVETLRSQLRLTDLDPATKSSVSLTEFNDRFKLEIEMPGVKRENILIHVKNEVLSIVVSPYKLEPNEPVAECFKRQILLPKNADTEFISAEYRQGVLNFYIPKSAVPSSHPPMYVVAY
jgi:HSP20 family protein